MRTPVLLCRVPALLAPLWCLVAAPVAFGLPEDDGRTTVEAVCTACHQANLIERSAGYTHEGWQELTATMVDLSGNPSAREQIVGYLAKHFPPNTARAPVLVPGPVRIAFEEWVAPTPGQRARDPVEAPDGSIWWAGQWGNLIGRIDPASGAMQEYPLPEGAMPHTVTVDAAGGIWFTGNKNATLGRLDPGSGEITEFPMPDPQARDPHSAVFDARGRLFFTLQHSNRVGRLDPASGEILLAEVDIPDARPYGIKIDASGVPWVACNGSNCLLKVDPETLGMQTIRLPSPQTTVRRLAFDAEGVIWFVNSSLGRLGRYDPRSGDIKEWPSPSGPRSHPYAIAVVDGVVWYNESGQRPDTLVRFDPATEAFQSWAIPSGGVYAGIVRHMRPTRDGRLLIHQGATNRIIRVDLGAPASAR